MIEVEILGKDKDEGEMKMMVMICNIFVDQGKLDWKSFVGVLVSVLFDCLRVLSQESNFLKDSSFFN